MTPNGSLSIPAALKRERPDDYYRNAAPIDWPNGVDGQTLVIEVSRIAPWPSRLAGRRRLRHFLAGEG
jgi:hypothetical protein